MCGHTIADHFVDVTKMVVLGSGTQHQIDDVMLTRKAELIEQLMLEAEWVSARKKLAQIEKELE